MTLKEAAPREFAQEFQDTPAWKHRDAEVTEEIDGTKKRWPGPHKYVFVWYKLANGLAVGWNENPARGWSFPVIRLKP